MQYQDLLEHTTVAISEVAFLPIDKILSSVDRRTSTWVGKAIIWTSQRKLMTLGNLPWGEVRGQ